MQRGKKLALMPKAKEGRSKFRWTFHCLITSGEWWTNRFWDGRTWPFESDNFKPRIRLTNLLLLTPELRWCWAGRAASRPSEVGSALKAANIFPSPLLPSSAVLFLCPFRDDVPQLTASQKPMGLSSILTSAEEEWVKRKTLKLCVLPVYSFMVLRMYNCQKSQFLSADAESEVPHM